MDKKQGINPNHTIEQIKEALALLETSALSFSAEEMRTVLDQQFYFGLDTALSAPAAPLPEQTGPSEAQKEAMRDALSATLGDAMDCTRTWKAWGVGTMTEDDFELVADNDERLDELVEAVAAVLASPSPAPAPTQPQDEIEARTERIRLSHANADSKGKIQLRREVEWLLAHIALLRSP